MGDACSKCGGVGSIWTGAPPRIPCPDCGGSGMQKPRKDLMFQLYQNPRAGTIAAQPAGSASGQLTDVPSQIVTVLGIWVDEETVLYLITDDDPKSSNSGINPRFILGSKVSLFVGRG